jgi:prophage tail gpP-like protein
MADEKATLIVGGKKFEDWETVWVQRIRGDGFHQFRFTAAERDLASQGYAQLQIKPEDECIIELAGDLAINGMVVTRQAAFDEGNHGVLLQGVSKTWAAARAGIVHETGNFDGKTFMQIAEEVLKPTGVKGTKIGTIGETPFRLAQVHPGENIFQFLTRLATDAKVLVSCTKDGDFLFVGEHKPQSLGALIEGQNIRKCQATISVSAQRSEYILRNQGGADDKDNMRKQSEQEAKETGKLKKVYSPIVVPNEQPTWTPKELQERAKNESMWTEAQAIQATVVVQGWTAGNGKIWEEGKSVSIKSKMAMLDMELVIQSVTFTQDNNSGTLTTLLCVPPWSLNVSGYALGQSVGATLDRTPGSPD